VILDIAELKDVVIGEVDTRRDELNELSLKIHDNPELGFKETRAATWLTQYLAEHSFSIDNGIYGLDTAFLGSYGAGEPTIALLAEYDALPGLGHACGHNLIATAAVGAAVAARPAVDRWGGRVVVIGTPAEELYGGKVILAGRGAFTDVDVAMMVHPATFDVATIQALACQNLVVEFLGRAAHAAANPELGINALEAMVQSFVAINSLRQHIKNKARIHGIITEGGKLPNIVPDRSAGVFMLRAEDDAYLDELKQKVLNCFVGAATASGARLVYQWEEIRYSAMRNNLTLARLFQQNMTALGRSIELDRPGSTFFSTDMGNVSQLVPSIHPMVAITAEEIGFHSPQFAEAVASATGSRGLLDATKALAMTVVDLLADPEIMTRVKKEFQGGKQLDE
jgi:amidohydrolase